MTEEKQFPFENLRVWKNSVELSNEIFEVIRDLKGEDEYELADQLKRSATSIALNIAEGKGKRTDADFLNYLYTARGSLYETATCLKISRDQNLISESTNQSLREHLFQILSQLSGLINSME